VEAGSRPSIFGSQGGAGASPKKVHGKSGAGKDSIRKIPDAGKTAKVPVEEIHDFLPSAKELKEAKELFRQFDTDGDGTLTIAEIQSSLYFNNVDYEEIQAILGPNGVKGSGPGGSVSVDEFAQFLCKRRRENANRQQSSQVSKHSRIARVYVSSCIHQHYSERKILHEKVFPELVNLCESLGGEFVPVDLRYHSGPCPTDGVAQGPSQAEAMSELSRVATDRNYMFLGLVADLPGECVLPSEVSMAEFETLRASAKIIDAASDEKGLPQALEALYVPDKNAVTQTYVLKNGSEADMAMVLRAFAEQEGEEKQLHSSFTRVRAKIAKSLNEQEVTKCLSLGSELDQARRTFVCSRQIEDVPIDLLKNQLPGKGEDEVLQIMDRQNIFRENIADRLSPHHFLKYSMPWTEPLLKIQEGSQYGQKAPCEILLDDYLEKFATDVYRMLSGPIIEMLSRPAESPLDIELEAHSSLMRRNAASIFKFDKDPMAREIMEYVFGSKKRDEVLRDAESSDPKTKRQAKAELEKIAVGNSPYIVTGEIGLGKTALLAACAEKFSYSKEAGQCALIYRKIGATPFSSDGRLLLDGLCEEIARILGQARTGNLPPAYNNLLVEFAELLRMLSNKKTVVMFLDGLSELPDTDHARRLSWLPTRLPARTYVVASCCPNNPAAIIKYPKPNIKELKAVEEADYTTLLQHWLENYKQGLQQEQIDDVIKTAADISSDVAGFKAHLRLAFDEATNNVTSFSFPDKLSDITTQPGILVFECLGLICVSRGGLSEAELRKLVDLEEGCKAAEALPYRMFNRIMHRLAPYVTYMECDDRIVTCVRHDSYKEIILNRPGFSDYIKEWNAKLAALYAAQPTKYGADQQAQKMNPRKLRNLVYYQLAAEMWSEACSTLCSIEYIQAMCEARMSVQLQALFTFAIRVIPESFCDEETKFGADSVKDFYRFFIRTVQALAAHSRMIEQPGLVIQMGANEPKDTLPELQANEILVKDGDSRVWMQAANKAVSASPLYATLVGSRTAVRSSHISSDGSLIATGSDNGEVQIWDSETGESVNILTGHKSAVNGLRFVASTSTLVSVSSDCTAKVWDEPTATCLCTYSGHSTPILGLSISPDGKVVVSGSEGKEVHMWTVDGTPLKKLEGHTAAVRACAFSNDGSRLATASQDKTVRVWDVETGKCLFVFEHIGRVYDVHFSLDSKKIISSSSFATCTLWDLEKAKPVDDEPERQFKTGSGTCFSCAFVDNDKKLVMASELGFVFFWDIKDAKSPIKVLKAHTEIIFKTSVSLGGKWLVTSGADKLTRVWNLHIVSENIEADKVAQQALETETKAEAKDNIQEETVEREHAMTGEDGLEKLLPPEDPTQTEDKEVGDMPDIVRSIALSEDGVHGVSCSEFGNLLVWDLEKAEMVVRCKLPAVARVVRFVPKKFEQPERFVAGCDDGIIRVYDLSALLTLENNPGKESTDNFSQALEQSKFSPCVEIGFHDLCIRSLKFCKDGERFVTGSIDATARIWRLGSLSQELCLEGHKDTVLDAEMGSNMQIVVTGSTDKTVRVWKTGTGKEQWVGKHGAYVYAVTCSPDCRRAISASGDRTVRVWASKKGECLHILKAKSALLTCQISEMGQLLCTGYEGCMHLWDIKAFEAPPMEGIGHGAEIRDAGFSKYGGFCITASNDGSVRVFDTRTGISLGALPLPLPVYSMASVIDEDRAVCMCGDEQGNVIIVRINGVRDQLPVTNLISDESFSTGGASPLRRRSTKKSVL
jgi:WD40 repeat protein